MIRCDSAVLLGKYDFGCMSLGMVSSTASGLTPTFYSFFFNDNCPGQGLFPGLFKTQKYMENCDPKQSHLTDVSTPRCFTRLEIMAYVTRSITISVFILILHGNKLFL